MNTRCTWTALATAVALGAACSARAGTNGFLVPSFRGTAGAEAGYWETFAVVIGAPGNVPDKAGATTGAVLTQNQTNAIPTGSGNIYNVEGTSDFTVSDAMPTPLGTVVMQTRTLGTELDYGSALLRFTNELGAQTLTPLARFEVNRGVQPGLGATVSSLWQWDLTGLGITNYSLTFRAAGPSTSFDSLTLDTAGQFTPIHPQPFVLTTARPSLERWMYPHNAEPCTRIAGSSFGTMGDEAGVDTRHAQHLLGWDTAALVPTNRGPSRYLVRRVRVTLTINRGNLFAFDPTPDDFRTYFETNHPARLEDTDTGRPIELFGIGFRNGFDAASFDQCSPMGSVAPGERNAFATGWSSNVALVDVSNNVGKTNEAFPRFEVTPFAIGQTTNVAPGALVPAGAKITFDLNLADPLVLQYAQEALNSGRLRLAVTSLHTTEGQFGSPKYPDFLTRFNEVVVDPTSLEVDGVAVRDTDSDGDGLPDDWEQFYFASLAQIGGADPDGDGASNAAERTAGTDPASAASVLKIPSIVRSAPLLTSLQWPVAASRAYTVLFSEDLLAWQGVTNPPVLLRAPGLVEWRDTAAGGTNRYYRIATQPR